jgi:hypothetical protein
MVSNVSVAPDEISPRPEVTPQAHWLAKRVVDRAREIFCGLHGHQHLLQFQHGRMFLRCLSCGHESSGWELNARPPIVTAH